MAASRIVDIPDTVASVTVLQCAMPSAMASVIVVARGGCDRAFAAGVATVTTVAGVHRDAAGDRLAARDLRCSIAWPRMKLFVAIEVPDALRAILSTLPDAACAEGWRRTSPTLMHVTIRLLGDLPADRIDALPRALDVIPACCGPVFLSSLTSWAHAIDRSRRTSRSGGPRQTRSRLPGRSPARRRCVSRRSCCSTAHHRRSPRRPRGEALGRKLTRLKPPADLDEPRLVPRPFSVSASRP